MASTEIPTIKILPLLGGTFDEYARHREIMAAKRYPFTLRANHLPIISELIHYLVRNQQTQDQKSYPTPESASEFLVQSRVKQLDKARKTGDTVRIGQLTDFIGENPGEHTILQKRLAGYTAQVLALPADFPVHIKADEPDVLCYTCPIRGKLCLANEQTRDKEVETLAQFARSMVECNMTEFLGFEARTIRRGSEIIEDTYLEVPAGALRTALAGIPPERFTNKL